MSSASERTRSAYAQVPYRSGPWRNAHPERLAAIGRLHGLDCPGPTNARVLEIGCADGGNLLPLAAAYPGARFLGIDLAPNQIEDGRRRIDRTGLSNIELRASDLTELDESVGFFDFILAHGIVSWLPHEVRHALLDRVGRLLTPAGTAFLSFNARPGFEARRILRDLLRHRTAHLDDLTARAESAREFLEEFVAGLDGETAWGRMMKELAEPLLERDALHYLAHEYLEAENHAFFFDEHLAELRSHGLRYLDNADTETAGRLRTELADTAVPPDDEAALTALELRCDAERFRPFRQVVVCRADVSASTGLRPEAVAHMWVAGRLSCEASSKEIKSAKAVRFESVNGLSFRLNDPLLKAALRYVALRGADPIPVADLLQTAREFLRADAVDAGSLYGLLAGLFEAGAVELSTSPPPWAREPGERPEASAVARDQVRLGEPVTNLRHERLEPATGPMARLIPLLTGGLAIPELTDAMNGVDPAPLLRLAAALGLLKS